MKKIYILAILISFQLIALTTNGQIREIIQAIPSKIDTNGVFQKKGHHFFLGLGFPNLVFKGSELANNIFLLGFNTKKVGLLTYVSGYEYGISDKFSIGLNATYASGSYTYTSLTNPTSFFKYSGTFYSIGIRSSYHIIVTDKWNLYTGAMFAYKKSNVKVQDSGGTASTLLNLLNTINDSKGSIGYDVFAGVKYFPPNKSGNHIGIFAEAGYGITVIKAGVVLAKLSR
jgi:hypothetical protein